VAREYSFLELVDPIGQQILNACSAKHVEKFARKQELASKIDFSKSWLSVRPFDEVALTSPPPPR
jgi:hypothetical protein